LKFEYPYLPKTFEKNFIKEKENIFIIFWPLLLKILYECLWILKFEYPYLPKTFEKNFIKEKENIFILFMDIHFAKNLLTKKFKKMNL
jgi:hypothetical protein